MQDSANSIGTGAGQLTLKVVVTALFRRRWIVLAVFIPIILFGIWGTLTTTSVFMARTRVLVQARTVESPEFQHIPVDNDVLISTAIQVAQSIPVAEKAAEALMDSLAAFKSQYPQEFRGIQTVTDLRDLILSDLGAGQIGESNVVEIGYSHPIARFAMVVVAAVTKSYLEYAVESKQNKAALDYYTEQIGQLEGEIRQLLDRRLEVYSQGGMAAFKENNTSGIQHMRAMEFDYHKVQSRRIAQQRRLDGLLDAIAVNPYFVPTVTSAGENANLIGARQQLDEATMELAKTRVSYNDSSRFVQRQIAYVAQAESIFVEIRNNYVRDVRVELDMLRAEEGALARDLEAYQAELQAYPALERDLYSIDLDVESKKDLLEALQTKRGAIRLKAYGDQRISNVTQLDEPSIDPGVKGGKKAIYLLLSGLLGALLSLVVGLLVDSMDHRIYSPRQAEASLGVPVFGAVTEPGSARGRR